MGETYAELGGIPLDVIPFDFPFYRGFDIRPISITQGNKRFVDFDNIAKAMQEVTFYFEDGQGGTLLTPVRILRIEPRSSQHMEIILVDRRFELLRYTYLTDFNINMVDQIVPDTIGDEERQGKRRIKEYLPGTASANANIAQGNGAAAKLINAGAINKVPIMLPEAINQIFNVIIDQYGKEDPKPFFDWSIDPQSDIGSIRVPDHTFTAGTKMIDALRTICEPHGVEMWVDFNGTYQFIKRDNTLIPLSLKNLNWKNTPAWEQQIGANYHKPKDFIVQYLIKEELEARTRETTEAAPAKNEYRIENVYYEDGDIIFNNIRDYVGWLDKRFLDHASFSTLSAAKTLLDDYFLSANWAGTPLQLNPNLDKDGNEQKLIASMGEAERVVQAQRIVSVIESCYRQTYRVIVVGPSGQVPPSSISFEGLVQPLGAQGYWDNVQFGSIKVPIAVGANDINQLRDPDDVDGEDSISETDFMSGGAVISRWVDQFNRPLDNPEIKNPEQRLKSLRFWRNNAKEYAPFTCSWVSQKRLIFRISPNLNRGNIAARFLGNLQNLPRVVLPTDKDYKMLKFAKMLKINDWNSPNITVAKLAKDEVIRVRFTGTRRAPQGQRKMFHEVKSTGFKDGQGIWFIAVDPTKYSLLPLGPDGIARTEPINQKALQRDADARVAEFMSRSEMNGSGSAWAHGIGAIKNVKLEYALNEMTIEYGREGIATMLTRLDVGDWRPIAKVEQENNADLEALMKKMAERKGRF